VSEAQSNTAEVKFENWCVVELMGHQRIAGLVTEVNLFGSALMRVDVPAVNGTAAYTKFFGASAIYAITPVSEAIARSAAQFNQQRPVETWQLPALQRDIHNGDHDSSYPSPDEGADDED